VIPARATTRVWRSIARPMDMNFKASQAECDFRHAVIDSVPREAVIALIARHLHRVCKGGSRRIDWMYTTPRLWYAAPFR
jgi:hypothetical protein